MITDVYTYLWMYVTMSLCHVCCPSRVEWCEMVWNGVEWCGMVWNGVEWRGMVAVGISCMRMLMTLVSLVVSATLMQVFVNICNVGITMS